MKILFLTHLLFIGWYFAKSESIPTAGIDIRKPLVRSIDKYLRYYVEAAKGNLTISKEKLDVSSSLSITLEQPFQKNKYLSDLQLEDLKRFAKVTVGAKNEVTLEFSLSRISISNKECYIYPNVDLIYYLDIGFSSLEHSSRTPEELLIITLRFELNKLELIGEVFKALDGICNSRITK